MTHFLQMRTRKISKIGLDGCQDSCYRCPKSASSQGYIASYLNMSQNGYSQYETETTDIPTSILKKLANFYNTSIDYLLFETDNREPYPKSILKK